jgi:prepilin-type N-terminal cleavage/methylation domain-containing protein
MKRRGLTLVELVVAMAITTLLAVAALQVVGALARTERVASAAEETDSLGASLRLLLAGDLLGADRTRETGGGFTIRTHTYLAPGGGAPQHLPSLVTYEVRQVGQRSCLFRRQQCLVEPETCELVATGVQAIKIAATGTTTADGWRGLAQVVTVTLEFSKGVKTDFAVRRQ